MKITIAFLSHWLTFYETYGNFSKSGFKNNLANCIVNSYSRYPGCIYRHCIQSGKGPEGVLRFIASGAFGKAAFSGGAIMIFYGLLFHYVIALSFTIIFYWLYRQLKFLRRNIFITAALCGILIWLVMNGIVVPLSNTPKFTFHLSKVIKPILILMCMIGFPLAVIMNRLYTKGFTKILS